MQEQFDPFRQRQISTLIFDLGAVLYGIDFTKMSAAFAQLCDRYGSARPASLMAGNPPAANSAFETGALTAAEFRDAVRSELGFDALDAEIDAAWNALLTGFYPGRAQMLRELGDYYRIALLSNTNAIHFERVTDEAGDLFDPFERIFASYRIGYRKPDRQIFDHAAAALGIAPQEALFIDDTREHIGSANEVGFHTVWLQHPESLQLIAATLLEARR